MRDNQRCKLASTARWTPPVNRRSTVSPLPCRSVADTGALRSIVKPEKCSPSCFGVRQHPVDCRTRALAGPYRRP